MIQDFSQKAFQNFPRKKKKKYTYLYVHFMQIAYMQILPKS